MRAGLAASTVTPGSTEPDVSFTTPAMDCAIAAWCHAIAQDRDGYLWVGGPSGLFRFDGVRFADTNELGLSSLPHAPVMALQISRRDGALWIGLGDGMGVRIIRNGRVDRVTPDTALSA